MPPPALHEPPPLLPAKRPVPCASLPSRETVTLTPPAALTRPEMLKKASPPLACWTWPREMRIG
jgi:hypothetical protein